MNSERLKSTQTARSADRVLRHIASLFAAMALLGPVALADARGGHHPTTPDTSVARWDAVGAQAFTAAGLSPAEGFVIFGYIAVAEYDAVMAIRGGYEPFAIRTKASRRASAEAAVAAAAHRVLSHHLPGQTATILDPALAESLAGIPDGPAKAKGIETGERVAARLIAQRADDGFRAVVPYVPPSPPIPGVWLPTATTPPIGTYLGGMRPFALESAGQFRPAGPPALSSRQWAEEYNEVKTIGSSTSATRTPEQTVAARFWGEAPVQQARRAYRELILARKLDVVDAARLNAMVSVTYADAIIACFDAKYHYRFWRPITAIRAGDTDGNDATLGDPTWATLLAATPNHPEYPSAHSCITPAGGRALARFLGTRRIGLTIPSLTGLGDRHYATLKDLESEVKLARIWGGIHFRSAVDDGATIARRTARYVLSHHFHPEHH